MGNHIGLEFSKNHFSGYEELVIIILDEKDEFKWYIQELARKCANFMDIITNTSLTGPTTVYTLKITNPDFKHCNEKRILRTYLAYLCIW